MQVQSYSGNQGFTLVESVISVIILGFALGACILSFSLAMRVVGTGQNQMIALHAARFELEQLRTNKFFDVRLKPGSYTFTNSYLYGTSLVTNGGTLVITSVNTNTKNIAVSVSYVSRLRGYTLTNTLTTTITSTLHQ